MLNPEELKKIVDIGIELTAEKDENLLLDKILSTGMKVANCDAGALLLKNDNELEFKILKTDSKNISKGAMGEQVDIEPVPVDERYVSGYAVIHRKLIKVDDVSGNKQFDLSKRKFYDRFHGYKTKNMLAMPMINSEDEIVGVILLMNAMDSDGDISTFDEDDEYLIRTLASQAAVSISNVMHIHEIKEQMYSFIDAFSTVSDARTPYNGYHTKKVTKYAGLLADEINKKHEEGKCIEYFDENRREQLILAASLHDIGKLVVPLSIMNKATRLEGHLENIAKRYTLIEAYYEIDKLKGHITGSEFEFEKSYLRDSLKQIEEINTADYVTDAQIETVHRIASHSYHKAGGETIPYLTQYERECLCIRKGTLTRIERKEMESHVVMTKTILDKVHFNSQYSKVTEIASTHHELLDGKGYPNGLRGEQLSLETRILAVVDIYDALTSKDRPYKKPVEKEKAFGILEGMAKEGKLDLKLINYLKEAL